MKYKLINKTKFSTKRLRNLVDFALPKGLNNKSFRLIIEYGSSTFEGEYMPTKNAVSIKINDKIKFPTNTLPKSTEKYGYMDRSILKSIDELFVSLLSHELRHLWQFKVSKQDFRKSRYVYMKWWSGDFLVAPRLERDATLYSRRMLLKYREHVK